MPAAGLNISAEIIGNHEDLSDVSVKFLDFVGRHPSCLKPLTQNEDELPEFLRGYSAPLQAWPTFVGAEKMRLIKRATLGVPRLIATIPERIFKNDITKISTFYGINDPALTSLVMAPPTGIEGLVSRGDFYDTQSGFKCMEVNMSGQIGGWRTQSWADAYHKKKELNQFIEETGITPKWQHPVRTLFKHIVTDTHAAGLTRQGQLNIAVVVDPEYCLPGISEFLNGLYQEVLRSLNLRLSGKAFGCSYAELNLRHTGLYHGITRAHAVVEHTIVQIPKPVFRAFKGRMVKVYNAPIGHILSNKNNLALLSLYEDSDLYNDDEKSIIRDHIPWSRILERTTTSFKGETISLPDDLIGNRASFVIKPCQGAKGEGVFVGAFLSQKQWEDAVNAGVTEKGWLVQEYLDSKQYLYQYGDEGARPHDVVWGTFCFGQTYGGGFLRMMSREVEGATGVINSFQGSDVSFIFEV